MPIDTAKVTGRRQVAYKSLQEVLADAERLSAGKTRTLGNWSPGQIFVHLAKSFDGSIDGLNMKFPWYLRMMARLMKGKLLKGPMPPGFKLPEGARSVEPAPTSTEEGLAALRAAVARQEHETKRAPSPIFGPITPEEWAKIHLIHSNLHMSFLVPEN
jgi:hypothetical protein